MSKLKRPWDYGLNLVLMKNLMTSEQEHNARESQKKLRKRNKENKTKKNENNN